MLGILRQIVRGGIATEPAPETDDALRVEAEHIQRELLDILGKAMPYSFRPILQIDPVNARPVIEALSGRWSFEKDRRDTRNASWHVANALTLLLSRLELWKAMPKDPKPPRLPPSPMSA